MKEETGVEFKEEFREEFGVEMREEIREPIAAEVIEEIRVEIKDGEFGVSVNEEGGENQAEIYPKKQDGENQAAEYPQKQAKGLKLRRKGNPDNSKDDGKQSVQKAKQDIGNITQNGSRYSQLQETQFKCKQCEKRFTIKRELLRHTKIVHEGKTRMFKIRAIQNL